MSNITIEPAGRTFTQSVIALGQSATFIIGSGITTLNYTDALMDPGMLRSARSELAGEPNATFTVAQPRGTAPDITMGSDTLSVPVGQCVLDRLCSRMRVADRDRDRAGRIQLSAITVADPDRLVAGSVNLIPLGWGVRRNRHHDRDVHERAGSPPATTTTAASTSSGSTAGTSGTPSPAASTASTATTASTSTPTAAAVPQVTKTVKLAYVLSARIVALKTGRFVVVRVNGSAKTATIRVKLIGADGKVLRTVLRTVTTNHAVRIANLSSDIRSTASGLR